MVQLHDSRNSGGGVRHLGLAVLSLIIALALSSLLVGCVTSKKYRLAKPDTPAAQPLGLSVGVAPAELTLATVIVFQGPGSWKREARWDEYVVVLGNRGGQPILIESAELIDLRGQMLRPGDDPWKLEKLSRTNWGKYGKTGLKLAAGIGATALYAGAVYGSAQAAVLSGGGAASGGLAVLSAIPIVGLVDVAVVAVMNHKNKATVQEEFQRRRFSLPRQLAPEESMTASFFFPMTPGPQRLIVRGRDGERPLDIVLELKPLAGLHLKTG